MNTKELANLLQERSIAYEQEGPLARYTTFQTGGRAEIIAHPACPEEGDFLFQYARQNKIDFFILGGGSNLLISDKGFGGLVIKADYPKEFHLLEETKNSVLIETNASCPTSWFSRQMAERGYAGAQFLATIPGTLGGALLQNAGCYGGEMSQVVKSALISNGSGMHKVKATEMELAYRSSAFKNKNPALVHSIVFELTPGQDPAALQSEIDKNRQMRLQSQPKNRKSAGSVFKNPPGQKAWQLIEAAGCQGMQIGGALLSPEHSNFIVNDGGATSADIFELMRTIQDKVKDQSGILLEPEIVLIGDFS